MVRIVLIKLDIADQCRSGVAALQKIMAKDQILWKAST
jgi:hypothetical protein